MKKFLLFFLILGTSGTVLSETMEFVSDSHKDLLPRQFCKDNISKEKCLGYVSKYVALQHIRANLDYYENELDQRLEQYLESPEGLTYVGQTSSNIISEVASYWLENGQLPDAQ